MKKRYTVLGFVLIHFGLAACARSDNPEYATYSNPQLGIEFRYPKSWKNFPLMPNNGRDIVTYVPGDVGANDIRSSITLGLLVNTKNKELNDYISGYCSTFKADVSRVSKGEIEAVKAVYTYPNPCTYYYFMRPNTRTPVFTFGISGTALSLEKELISSIHFIQPDGTPIPNIYPDYGVMFEGKDSEASRALKKILGM